MILNKEIEINIVSVNLKFYKDKYKCKPGDRIIIDVYDLPKGSSYRIDCRCKLCDNVYNIKYSDYNKNISKGGYYCCINCKHHKIENTNLEKYGVKTTLLVSDVQEKIKNTLIKNYGVDHPMKSEIIIKKATDGYIKTYSLSGNSILEKRKQTSLELYGTEHPIQSNEIKNKVKETFLINYGYENCFQSEEIKNKSKNTCIEKYGVELYSKSNQYKEQMKEFISNNPEHYNKAMEKLTSTCIERYGVPYPAQNEEYYDELQKRSFKRTQFKNSTLYYQGNYELDFLLKCEELGIINEISRGIKIKYNFNDKDRIYFPDFYIKKYNLMIEIKSDYYFNLSKEQNLIKESETIKNGYNFLFIINKNYNEFIKLINP